MAVIDKSLVELFRHRINKYCDALAEDNEAEEVIRLCNSIENSAKALRKMAKEEIASEEPQE
jgi:hypothetical protein